MKPFRREQRESRPGGTQIETGLRTEDRSCSRACAVRSWLTFLDYEPEQIVVLSHAKILSCRALSRNRILLLFTHAIFAAAASHSGKEQLRRTFYCEIRAQNQV